MLTGVGLLVPISHFLSSNSNSNGSLHLQIEVGILNTSILDTLTFLNSFILHHFKTGTKPIATKPMLTPQDGQLHFSLSRLKPTFTCMLVLSSTTVLQLSFLHPSSSVDPH